MVGGSGYFYKCVGPVGLSLITILLPGICGEHMCMHALYRGCYRVTEPPLPIFLSVNRFG